MLSALARPIVALLALPAVTSWAQSAPEDELPAGFVRVLPRGRIPAIDAPVFVPAAEAELPDDAWVLGLSLDGQARAYSLNLLNRHEVVNDRIGERAFAAVW